MSKQLPKSMHLDLQNYVMALLKVSGKNIHTSEVIPSCFDQSPKFETLISGLKYDRSTGWFSINEDFKG